MVCLSEYKANKAETCEITRVTDLGPGSHYFVRLPDGFLPDAVVVDHTEEQTK